MIALKSKILITLFVVILILSNITLVLRCWHCSWTVTAPLQCQDTGNHIGMHFNPVSSEHSDQSVATKNHLMTSQFEPGPDLYKLMKERKTYEIRMEKSMRESWWYLQSKLAETQKIPTNTLDSFLRDSVHSIQNQYDLMKMWYMEMNSVAPAEGAAVLPNWEYWRQNISTELQSLMQKRLHHLQNPKDCNSARKLVCEIRDRRDCGFGCQMHHVCLCFIMAYASERTLVFEGRSYDWLTNYDQKGWNAIFEPLTSCHPVGDPDKIKEWTLNSTEKIVKLPPTMYRSAHPPQLPMSVPRDIADRLASFHGFPFVWFVSQFLHYLMRPAPVLKAYLKQREEKLGLSSDKGPIVGVHIRHTDKYYEAPLFPLPEYMKHVDTWYDWYDLTHGTKVTRRVFIATDDKFVVGSARTKYPKYVVLGDAYIASLSDLPYNHRYSHNALFGVISDVDILSKCDYLVLTQSSTLGRLAYGLMQRYHVDASNLHYSVHGIYWFHGQTAHNIQALQSHTATRSRELSFSVGDLFLIDDNTKNGTSLVNLAVGSKKKKLAQVPSYKFEHELHVADFPTYIDVQ